MLRKLHYRYRHDTGQHSNKTLYAVQQSGKMIQIVKKFSCFPEIVPCTPLFNFFLITITTTLTHPDTHFKTYSVINKQKKTVGNP